MAERDTGFLLPVRIWQAAATCSLARARAESSPAASAPSNVLGAMGMKESGDRARWEPAVSQGCSAQISEE